MNTCICMYPWVQFWSSIFFYTWIMINQRSFLMCTLHFRWIPEETGWIIDGFPTNLYQAKVLEKALTGFSAGDKKDDKSSGKMKRSNLVKDPRPTPPPADPASGLDVVINFEVPDELCLKRSAGRLRMYPIISIWILVHLCLNDYTNLDLKYYRAGYMSLI